MSTPQLGSGRSTQEYRPVPNQAHDIGWALCLVTALGLCIASWTLFGTDATGMWQGYLVSLFSIVTLFAVASLRTTLARPPALAAILASGLATLGFGLSTIGHDHTVGVVEIIFGALLVASAGLQA